MPDKSNTAHPLQMLAIGCEADDCWKPMLGVCQHPDDCKGTEKRWVLVDDVLPVLRDAARCRRSDAWGIVSNQAQELVDALSRKDRPA